MTVATDTKDQEIQKNILQAAKQLFQLYGFRKVTIDDIAKAIGKARSSLYYYYKTKEEILDAVVAAEITELATAITAAVSQEQTAEEKIKAFFLTKLQTVVEKRGFFDALDEDMNVGEISGYQNAKLAVHYQIWNLESNLLNQIITGGIERGELTKLSQKDQDNLIFVLLSSQQGIKREIVIRNDFSNSTSIIEVLIRSTIYGLKK